MASNAINEIRRRGDVIGGWYRSGCPLEGAGTGISPLLNIGKPRGTGCDQSNLSAIIAMQKYTRSGQPLIDATLQMLEQCAAQSAEYQAGIQLWLYHYCATGSQRDKAEAAGVSLATYKTRFKSIEAVLVGYLIAGGRAA